MGNLAKMINGAGDDFVTILVHTCDHEPIVRSGDAAKNVFGVRIDA